MRMLSPGHSSSGASRKIGLRLVLHAERGGQHVAVGMDRGFFRGELAFLNQPVDHGMIARHLRDGAVVHQVETAVADVAVV